MSSDGKTQGVIAILLFAQLREVLGCHRLELALPAPLTVAALKARLAARGDLWHLLFAEQQVLCAINQVISDDQQTLHAGDEVAFFPPVTGG